MLQVAREQSRRSSEDIPFAPPRGMTCGQSLFNSPEQGIDTLCGKRSLECELRPSTKLPPNDL